MKRQLPILIAAELIEGNLVFAMDVTTSSWRNIAISQPMASKLLALIFLAVLKKFS